MKTAIFTILALIVGLALGTFYGWRTGFVDGQVHAQIMTFAAIKKYGTLRTSTETAPRDRIIDMLAMGSGVLFANGYSYSPVFPFVHPKADAALIDTAVYWELTSREPSTWKDGKQPPLFPNNSPEAARLDKLKQQMRAYYDRELEKQQKQRQSQTPGNA